MLLLGALAQRGAGARQSSSTFYVPLPTRITSSAARARPRDFTGMPMSDEGAPRRCSIRRTFRRRFERQCLAQAPWVGMYRPLASASGAMWTATTG